MEEKGRFSIGIINGILYLYDNFNKYNTEITLKDLSDLLNQQDKEIIKLEQENQQLKQSQKEFTIEKLKGLRDKICDIGYDEDYDTDYFEVMKEIDDQIKSLRRSHKQT